MFLVSIGFLFLVLTLSVITIIKIPFAKDSNSQVNETLKLIGRIFSVVYTVLLNCLALPLLINCFQIFSCSIFKTNTKFKCRSTIHIVFMVVAVISIIYFILIVILNALFGSYTSLKMQTPWAGRNIGTALLKFLKKLILIMLQLTVQKLPIIVILFCAVVSDFSIAFLLVYNNNYYYNGIQVVEILCAIVPLWWSVCGFVSIVTRIIRLMGRQ